MTSLNELPLYLRAEDVMKILPFCKTKVHAIMNDPAVGVVRIGRNKLWPKEKFLTYLESMESA